MEDYHLKLTYFARRSNDEVTLSLQKTESGWYIKHIAHNGETDPEGSPMLENNLEQDYVRYPVGVGSFLGHIWHRLHYAEIDEVLAQQMLNDVGRWISECEAATPKWRGYSL